MKARRLKALGFALLGGLALLLAGCPQQGGGGTGDGAVTSVGIQLPQLPPGAGGYSGTITVGVTVNEGARVRRVVLKVDGQQVNQIDVAGLRPQSINYTLLLDTAQLDRTTNQPRFRNGPRTLTVEVTDVNNNTRSASAPGVIFLNQDRVRGVVVSQTDNPRAPVTRGTTQWYGNGDVFVTVDIVNYSGATYSLSGSGLSFNLGASGGQGGSLSGLTVTLTAGSATPVSGQPQLRLARSANPTFSGTLTVTVSAVTKTFGLDNVAPDATGARVEIRRVLLEYNFRDLATFTPTPAGTSQTLFRGAGASDAGVADVTYRVDFKVGTNTVATATLPGAPSPGVTVSGLGNFAPHAVEITAVEDALGNRRTLSTPITAGSFQLADAPITLSSVNVSNTTPNAGLTFDVSFTASGGFGSPTPRVALKLGNRLVDFHGTTGVPARFGAQYVLYVVDSAGNFAVADLPVTVQQTASDRTPPTITVSLPSSVAPSGPISVSGTYSDSNPSSNVDIYLSHGSLGGFEWYRTPPTGLIVGRDGRYSTPPSPNAPDYIGPLGVVVLGLDRFNNLGSATGTVDVRP